MRFAQQLVDEEIMVPWGEEKLSCPICGRMVKRCQMERTYDCHGIPYRLVCGRCYDRIMDYPGFDGVEYDETDECIEYYE